VLEGLRRRSNPIRALPHQTISLETRFDLAASPVSSATDLHFDLDQWRILSQIAVKPSVRELCGSTGIAPDRALRALRELLAIGMVEIALPPRPAPRRASAEAERHPRQATRAAASREAPAAGRGLLQAVMRRVRGL